MFKNKYRMSGTLIGCTLIAGLSACTHVTRPTSAPLTVTVPANKPLTVEQKKVQGRTLAMNSWQAQGVVGIIRNHAKGFSGSFNWAQRGDSYSLNIYGPLGAGSVHIDGTPNRVTMVDSKNHHASASDAESLMQRQLGVSLPVSNLYYWMRGVPTPNNPAEKQFDSQHHLVTLQQDGWVITYQNYITVNGTALPYSVVLVSADMRVKFVIKQWRA